MRRARELAFAVTIFVGCHAAPPPPPPRQEPVVEPPPPPPPPPKCESLDEKCLSTATTRVTVEGTKVTIAPPEGWTFAHGASGVMATSNGSALAIASTPVTDAKKPPRAQALAKAAEQLGVTFPKRKKGKLDLPKKPDKTSAAGTLKVAFYQLDGAVREKQKGPLLVFTTNDPDGTLVLGAGFVPEDDTSNADAAILKAVESLSLSSKSAPP